MIGKGIDKGRREEGMRMKKGIGVAAVIMVVMAIVLIAFSSSASAESFDRNYTADGSGGFLWYEGALKHTEKPNKAGKILKVYAGEEIRFLQNETNESVLVKVSGPCESDGDWEDDYDDYSVPAKGVLDTSGKSKGYYVVKEDSNSEVGGWFNLEKHSIEVELVGDVKKVQEGKDFSLRIKKGENAKPEGVMKLTIEDDEGYSIMNINNKDIYEILVAYKDKEDFTGSAVTQENESVEGISVDDVNGTLVFETAKLKMEEGEYTVILEDYATEADDDVEIEVKKRYLEVECEEEEVVKGDDIVIIIDSSYFEKKVNITVEGSVYDEDKPLKLKLDKDGKKKVRISTESVDYGTHKITVEVCDTAGTKEKGTRYVTIMKGVASIEKVPEEASVGDIVFIKGKTNFGDFAVFLVDDEFKGEARISEKKGEKVFEWDWDTEGELDGYHGIEVFILSEGEYARFSANYSVGQLVDDDWQRGAGVDASAGILLLLPEFSMTVSRNIAECDEVVISGEATGTDHVYVIVFNYKGEVMFPAGGIAKTTAVEDEEWEENIGELDSGRYTVIALYEGKDGVTDAIKGGKWVAGDESKTLEQRMAILEDAMSSAGSDDQFGKRDFSVSTPKVSLEVPGTVEMGDAITVKAETNIREGEKAFISLSFNSSIIKKTSVLVKNGGSVDASINTSGSSRLLPGRYKVAVDISGRAYDEKEVILVEKKEEEQEGEEGKESMPQNESVTEPEAVAGAKESVGEGDGEINESQEGGEQERKIPVNVCDLLIAIVMAIFISIVVKRRR